MAFVTVADVSAVIGWTIDADTKPSESAVEGFIARYRSQIEGVMESRGVKIPVSETTSPNTFNMLFEKTLEIVAIITVRSHHTGLRDVPDGLWKDLREREKAWKDWIDWLRTDKGFLDDAEQNTDWNEFSGSYEDSSFSGSGTAPPRLRMSDEY